MPRWEIPYLGHLLALKGPVRRMVGMYMAQKGIEQPQAVAELLRAGYAQLVRPPLVGGGASATGRGQLEPRERPQVGPERSCEWLTEMADRSSQGRKLQRLPDAKFQIFSTYAERIY